jgi:3',5'-cyclic AMP phosphodiesterase CpdA
MRIAHVSDLHVDALAGVGPHRFLNKRLLGYVNLKSHRGARHDNAGIEALVAEVRRLGPDHVVVSGDLTNLALDEEFAAAKELVDALGVPCDRITVVPGNHDAYTRGAHQSGRFARHFAPYLESDLPDLAVDVEMGRFPVVKLRGPVAFIALTSAIPRAPLVSSGAIGGPQLSALRAILARPEIRSRTPIIVLHHPLREPRHWLRSAIRGLRDSDALRAELSGMPSGLVLHGHLHRRRREVHETARGALIELGATSASLVKGREDRIAGLNLYEIGSRGELAAARAHVLGGAGELRVIDL